MKKRILKIVALTLLLAAPFALLNNRTEAQNQGTSEPSAPGQSQEKPVEQVFKNIKVLNSMPQSQLYPAMRFMAASLGFQCGSCHVIKNGFGDFPADDRPEKQTARDM